MDSLSTIRDPRSPGDDFPSPTKSSHSSPHPDLNIEVATLSNKLISAINHQTHLDDALAATRQDLEEAHEKIRKLEAGNAKHQKLVESGALIKKTEVEELRMQLENERKQRKTAEKEKKAIELELETLSRELFEEANGVYVPNPRQAVANSLRWWPKHGRTRKLLKNAMFSYSSRSRIPKLYSLPTKNNWHS